MDTIPMQILHNITVLNYNLDYSLTALELF